MTKKLAADQSGQSDDEEALSDISGGATRKPLVGRLTDDRIRRLEELGFRWSLRDDWVRK